MATLPSAPQSQPRTLADIVPDDGTTGLLLDMAASTDKENPQVVEDYARRRELGILLVDPTVELDLHNSSREREVAQLEHWLKP